MKKENLTNAKIDKFINNPHIAEFLRDYRFSVGDIVPIGVPARGFDISYPVSGFAYIFWGIYVATYTCNHIYPYLSKNAIRKMMPQNIEWTVVKNSLLDYARRVVFLENYLLQEKNGKPYFFKISDNQDHLSPEKVGVNYAKILLANNFSLIDSLLLQKISCPKHFDWKGGDIYSWTAKVEDENGKCFIILCLLESGVIKIVPAEDVIFFGEKVDLDEAYFIRTNLFYFKVCHNEQNLLV